MSRRRRVIESEDESDEDISEIEQSQSFSPLRRSSRIRRISSQNDTDSDYDEDEDEFEDDDDNNDSDHNSNRNRSNRNNHNRNTNSDDDYKNEDIDTEVLYDEAKNEIEGAGDISSDDNKENDSDNDQESKETHPNFSILFPSFIRGLGAKYAKIDEDIEEVALTRLIDTAQSLAEYNSNQDDYKQQTQRLQTAMTKLLTLSKEIKIEKLMLTRVSEEIGDAENKFNESENNPIITGDWDSYLDAARDNVSNEIESHGRGQDAESQRIKTFVVDTTQNYKDQFKEAIQVDDIEDYDSGDNNNNRNRNNNVSDDDIDIVVDKSNKNVGSIKCPLTTRIFKKPFKSKVCGHTFEKEAIFKYIEVKIGRNMAAECPLPGCSNILSLDAMIRDVKIEKLIKAQSKHEDNESEDDAMFDLTVPDPDR